MKYDGSKDTEGYIKQQDPVDIDKILYIGHGAHHKTEDKDEIHAQLIGFLNLPDLCNKGSANAQRGNH